MFAIIFSSKYDFVTTKNITNYLRNAIDLAFFPIFNAISTLINLLLKNKNPRNKSFSLKQ